MTGHHSLKDGRYFALVFRGEFIDGDGKDGRLPRRWHTHEQAAVYLAAQGEPWQSECVLVDVRVWKPAEGGGT